MRDGSWSCSLVKRGEFCVLKKKMGKILEVMRMIQQKEEK